MKIFSSYSHTTALIFFFFFFFFCGRIDHCFPKINFLDGVRVSSLINSVMQFDDLER